MLSWIVGLTEPLFSVLTGSMLRPGPDPDRREDLLLLWKSTGEIHQLLEGEEGESSGAVRATFGAVILQIMVVDMVFSLDSIITAVGMVNEVEVMIAAVIVSVALMMAFAGAIGRFVSSHPTLNLALSFLVVIGVILIAEGFGHHVPKGYVYFAMAFSAAVEMLNIRMRRRAAKPVRLHEPYVAPGTTTLPAAISCRIAATDFSPARPRWAGPGASRQRPVTRPGRRPRRSATSGNRAAWRRRRPPRTRRRG